MAGTTLADPVNVNNADFENPNVADDNPNGGFDQNPTFGWSHHQTTGSHLSGVADPGVNQGAAFVGEDNYAHLILNFPGPPEPGGFSFYSQDIDAHILPNTTYTISLNVGLRQDTVFPTVGNGDTTGAVFTHFGMTATANLINEVATLVQSNATAPAPGQTTNWTLAWKTGPTPAMQDAGLYIRLIAFAEGGVSSALFDDVTVDVSGDDAVWTGGVSANWDDTGNWGLAAEPHRFSRGIFPTPVPGSVGSTITLASGQRAKSLTFADDYTLTGGSLATPSIDVAAGKAVTISSVLDGSSDLTKTGTGTLTLSGANTYTGDTIVTGGILAVTQGIKNGAALSVSDGAKAVVPSTTPDTFDPPTIVPSGTNDAGSMVSAITITGSGQLDLNNNDMVIEHDGSLDIADIRDLIASGYNFGGQDGPGIISTTAALTDPFTFTLGYADNASLPIPYGTTIGLGTLFAGFDVDDTAALIKFTWVGDVTLDGVFDFQDLSIFNGNYDAGATTGRVWTDGDLNYDGTIDFQDLSLFNGTYDPSKPSLPEPAATSLLALVAAACVRRRRRRERATGRAKSTALPLAAGALVIMGGAPGTRQAAADPVPINNADFEAQSVAANDPGGSFDVNATPGWFHNQTGGELSGINDVGSGQGAAFAGEDNYAAVITNLGPADGGFGFYVQDIAATVQPDTRYTLSLQVGDRNDVIFPTIGDGDSTGDVRTFLALSNTSPGGPEGSLRLTQSGGTINSLLTSTPLPPDGGVTTWTVVVDTGPVVTNQGNQLMIQLYVQSPGGAPFGAFFDDVSVDVSPVPEPAGAAVLAAGAALLLPGVTRRRRR